MLVVDAAAANSVTILTRYSISIIVCISRLYDAYVLYLCFAFLSLASVGVNHAIVSSRAVDARVVGESSHSSRHVVSRALETS